MSRRSKILFLSHQLPYPPESGAQSRTYHVLRQLVREFDITLLAFSRRNHHADADQRNAAWRELGRIATCARAPVPIAAERSALRRIADHLMSSATGRPISYYQLASGAFATQLSETLSHDPPALVHLDSPDLYRHLAALPRGVPVACTYHDIESHLLRRRAESVRPRVVAPYVRYQARLWRRAERELASRFALNVLTSAVDEGRLREAAPDARTLVVPNGVDTDYFAPQNGPVVSDRVTFVGPAYFFANRDAIDFLLGAIWPAIRQRRPGATLHLVGRMPPRERARYGAVPGVTVLGHVPDIRPHLADAACAVVPIRAGGGTRIKILDAWAMGKAVVSTSVGCEGLAAVDDRNLLIRDSAERITDAVVSLFEDPAKAARLGAEGRRTVMARYGWDVVGGSLRDAYHRLIEPSSPAG